jgi:hypothetical protein
MQPSELPSVEMRLRALEDERDILQCLYRYGHSIDYGMEDEFLDCFTSDAFLSYDFETANQLADTGIGDNDRQFQAQEAIVGFFHWHTNAPNVYHKHFLAEPRIKLEGDQASVSSFWTRLDRSEQGPVITSFGRYQDVFVRCPDGRWRIKERRGEIESCVPADVRSVR